MMMYRVTHSYTLYASSPDNAVIDAEARRNVLEPCVEVVEITDPTDNDIIAAIRSDEAMTGIVLLPDNPKAVRPFAPMLFGGCMTRGER